MVFELLIYALNNPVAVYGCVWLTDCYQALSKESIFRGFTLLIVFVIGLLGNKG